MWHGWHQGRSGLTHLASMLAFFSMPEASAVWGFVVLDGIVNCGGVAEVLKCVDQTASEGRESVRLIPGERAGHAVVYPVYNARVRRPVSSCFHIGTPLVLGICMPPPGGLKSCEELTWTMPTYGQTQSECAKVCTRLRIQRHKALTVGDQTGSAPRAYRDQHKCVAYDWDCDSPVTMPALLTRNVDGIGGGTDESIPLRLKHRADERTTIGLWPVARSISNTCLLVPTEGEKNWACPGAEVSGNASLAHVCSQSRRLFCRDLSADERMKGAMGFGKWCFLFPCWNTNLKDA